MARAQPYRSYAPHTEPPAAADAPPLPEDTLEYMNGLGGFADNGREYRVVLEEGQETPAPWVNVVANEDFGFLCPESGSGYTWAHNARENKLSPWSNDPVSDPPGKPSMSGTRTAGTFSPRRPCPSACRAGVTVARHGQGYSCFESTAQGIAMKLCQFVPLKDPLKISRLTLSNLSDRPRRLERHGYVEWCWELRPKPRPPAW